MTKTDEMRPWMDRLWRADNYDLQGSATATYRRAIRDGALVPADACEDCGRSEKRIHGHHEDYALPLDVAWLCPICHSGRHRYRWFWKENVLA